tara:strand:- start:470 stop:1882 length:1413 start_codon:yes stop_codon:yes gene_type:complete
MNIIATIIPEIFLSISIMILLIFGVFIKESFNIVYKSSIVVLIFAVLFLINNFENFSQIFNDSYLIDNLSNYIKTLSIISAIVVLLISYEYINSLKINKFEYPILIISSLLGAMIMISANDLIVFYMGLELQSLPLYVLASIDRENERSTEAGLKYFVLSALSSGLLLYGCSLIYGFTGSTNFQLIAQNFNSNNLGLIFGIVFIIVGLGFKISVVPFHMWTPDVYEGSPTSVTVFFALVPKIAAMTVFIRFTNVAFAGIFDQWQLILIFLSVGSMILGAVAAIGQDNIKRLMAYSSIGHMGYALAGILTGTIEGTKSTIIYLTIYAVMNAGMFACIFFMKRKEKYFENIKDLSGLSKTNPLLAVGFLIMLFSLAGIPPLAGFFAKFYIFVAVIESKLYLLAVIGLVTTVISAFYYLRIVKIIYFDESQTSFQSVKNLPLKFVLLTSSLIILLYFVYPSILIDMTSSISLG